MVVVVVVVQGLENLAEHLRSAYAGKSYLEVLREYPEGARKLYHRYFAVVCPLKNLSFGSAIEAWDALSFDAVFKSYAEWKEFLLHKQKLKGSISKAPLSLSLSLSHVPHHWTALCLIASFPLLCSTLQDGWQMLWAFAESEDRLLNEYSTDEAWPSIIDSFVEWKYEKEGRTFKSEVRRPSTRAQNGPALTTTNTHTHTHAPARMDPAVDLHDRYLRV